MSAILNDATGASSIHAHYELLSGAPGRVIAHTAQGPVDGATFLRQMHGAAQRLCDAPRVLNLCDDRYRFLLGFAAAMSRGITTLLPPSRAPGVLTELLRQHPGTGLIGDCDLVDALAAETHARGCLRLDRPFDDVQGEMPRIDGRHVAAIGFTSGSSGPPQSHLKLWGSFCGSTALNDALLTAEAGAGATVVATVPSQHMYGMETAVLLPLRGGVAIDGSRPFFPADIAASLQRVPAPRVLVTTPVHLRALVASGQPLPALAAIISATAPLSADLALAAERAFSTRVVEMFGSTETCVFAHRRTAHETDWRHYPGIRFAQRPDGTLVESDWLPEPVLLQDVIERVSAQGFRLAGRASDHLEIAGKRASLVELTRRLLAIEGVVDGVVFQPDASDATVRRVAALVVAPSLDEARILTALRETVDPVFLPRPLRCVGSLPRNATGKLPRDALLQALRGS